MCECVTPECDTDVRVYVDVCVCSCCLLLFSLLLFPGHTHTQLLSVSMHLTALKIATQSMLDLFLHQSHTSSHASFSLASQQLCHQLGAKGEESCSRRTASAMKEKMKSLGRPPLVPRHRQCVGGDYSQICMKLTVRGKKKERGSAHYQVMESDEREGVKEQIEI